MTGGPWTYEIVKLRFGYRVWIARTVSERLRVRYGPCRMFGSYEHVVTKAQRWASAQQPEPS